MIKLSNRLQTIADIILDNSKILDIGCDHGYLDIYLCQTKNNISVIASDINLNALNICKKNIEDYKLTSVIDIRLGNGLDVIEKDEVDTIVISGMGGITILNIIKNGLDKLINIKRIIIQSNTDIRDVRYGMMNMGFMITDEKIVIDNFIYYTIMVFEKKVIKYNSKELYFGPILLKENNDIFQKKCKIDLEKLKRIYKKIPFYKLKTRYKIYKLIRFYK